MTNISLLDKIRSILDKNISVKKKFKSTFSKSLTFKSKNKSKSKSNSKTRFSTKKTKTLKKKTITNNQKNKLESLITIDGTSKILKKLSKKRATTKNFSDRNKITNEINFIKNLLLK